MSSRNHIAGAHAVAQKLTSDWAQQGYRCEDDARQLADLVEDLIVHRRHVALSCRDPETLDHYSRLLVRDLRQRHTVKVIPYFPSSTDVLLTRLNELLAQITLEQARRRDDPQLRDTHVFVLHDTPSLLNAELTLLVRLISDLPGTQLRLVLVLDSEDQGHARLPLLGRRARHWDIPVSGASGSAYLYDSRVEPDTKPATADDPGTADATTASARAPWWRRLKARALRPSTPAGRSVFMLTLAFALAWILWPAATTTQVMATVALHSGCA